MPAGLPINFVIENSLTALIVVAYIYYEVHWGRFANFQERMEGVVDAVVALAREHDDIDEEKVANRVNGDSPEDLIKDGAD